MSIKPILFNTEMVRAILDKRKTVTRRVVKGDIALTPGATHEVDFSPVSRKVRGHKISTVKYLTMESFTAREALYRPGDILYVRETWAQVNESIGMGLETKKIIYRANYSDAEAEGWKWRPSIHMPREAARIWLRVTDVRVEKLRPMGFEELEAEGIDTICGLFAATARFADVWDSTIKPADREKYGWAANPFCWVISFERISKDEAMQQMPRD